MEVFLKVPMVVSSYTDLSVGLGIHQFNRISSSATNKNVVGGGAHDNGTSIRVAPNQPWRFWIGADGVGCAIDPTNEDIMFGSTQTGNFKKTIDGGLNHVSMNSTPENGSGAWITPIAIDLSNPNRIYMGYKNLYRNDSGANLGSNWVNTTPNISFPNWAGDPGGFLQYIETCPSDSNVIYVEVPDKLYKCSNILSASPTWTELTLANLGINVFSMNDIAVDPYDANRIVVVSSIGRVYYSTDGGNTWSRIEAGLPTGANGVGLPIRSAVMDRSTDQGIYVAMDGAVYYKSNTVTNWTLFSTNLPNTKIRDMNLYYGAPGESKIRVGTYGRGLWESPLYDDDENGNTQLALLTCENEITNFPYREGFESDFEGWEQNSKGNFNWKRKTIATPPFSTGPVVASEGQYYMYIEDSDTNTSIETAVLSSPCFDLRNLKQSRLSFKHQVVGTIRLEVTTDNKTWTTIWMKKGEQSGLWQDASINLSTYNSSIVRFRFRTLSTIGQKSSVCIDDVHISNKPSTETELERVLVFPNPATSRMYIQLPTNEKEIVVSVIDITGITVSETIFKTHKGLNLLKVDIDHIKEGTYFIHILGSETKIAKKIVIQE